MDMQTKKEIIGYTTKGKPLSKSELFNEVMEAINDVENGNFLTTAEVRTLLKKKNI